MSSPREFELKLAVPDGSVAPLGDHAALRPARPAQKRHEVTTYFDTRDRVLERHGISLRVRCINHQRVQTLKADSKASIAADRAEWEWPIQQDKPDLSLLAPINVPLKLPREQDLEPVLQTDIDRTVRVLELAGGSVIEAAYDEGTIIAEDAREQVRELELELRQGEPVALYQLALELHATVPLMVFKESKAERGYRLRNRQPPTVQKAPDVALMGDASAAEAFRQILTSGLSHLLVNRAAALSGDAEGIHQMRVAIRRLRAALTLLKPHLEAHATSRFVAELRRVGQVFGEARDWDVFCLQIAPDALGSPESAGWRDLLLHPAMARHEAAHRRVAEEVRSPAFTALVLGLAAWAEQGCHSPHLLGDAALEEPIRDVSPALLGRLARKVKRRGRHIDRSDADRHGLRKSLKKLRYAIEYLAAIYPREATNPYMRGCKKLQKILGDINDTVTATRLAHSLIDDARPDLAPAVGALATPLASQRDEALHRLTKRWNSFDAKSSFWA